MEVSRAQVVVIDLNFRQERDEEERERRSWAQVISALFKSAKKYR
jgi:hypothetical protein